jgi:EAL domain-containing protein (putative c-di-GMP-specific phosphodiesterase class I)
MLLQSIGERLQSELRQSDTIARMGGDEFAVLLPGTDAETARDVARRLVASLAQPFDTQGLPLQIEASIGIAMFPEDGKDASDVIQRADVAMYVAKRERTGFAVYELGRDFNSVRHLTLNGELRKAIDENHLVLYYQPKVSAKDGKIVGAEALVRWQHALFGMIPPDDFIALAEHSGLIKPLTQWVLNEAMRQASEWRRDGLPLPVAVNVSARNLLEKGMPEEVSRLLESHGLPPELLICEITESVIMEDRRRSLEAITKLVDMGVTIAIDDFGTGYSSLAYLRQLPAAEIKIDKSFVMRMDRDKDDAVIVGSTIQMAHSLGLKVVAEGVESERIWCELLARGCDYGQGYYFSRPVPANEFLNLVQASAKGGPFLPLMRQTMQKDHGRSQAVAHGHGLSFGLVPAWLEPKRALDTEVMPVTRENGRLPNLRDDEFISDRRRQSALPLRKRGRARAPVCKPGCLQDGEVADVEIPIRSVLALTATTPTSCRLAIRRSVRHSDRTRPLRHRGRGRTVSDWMNEDSCRINRGRVAIAIFSRCTVVDEFVASSLSIPSQVSKTPGCTPARAFVAIGVIEDVPRRHGSVTARDRHAGIAITVGVDVAVRRGRPKDRRSSGRRSPFLVRPPTRSSRFQ